MGAGGTVHFFVVLLFFSTSLLCGLPFLCGWGHINRQALTFGVALGRLFLLFEGICCAAACLLPSLQTFYA